MEHMGFGYLLMGFGNVLLLTIEYPFIIIIQSFQKIIVTNYGLCLFRRHTQKCLGLIKLFNLVLQELA